MALSIESFGNVLTTRTLPNNGFWKRSLFYPHIKKSKGGFCWYWFSSSMVAEPMLLLVFSYGPTVAATALCIILVLKSRKRGNVEAVTTAFIEEAKAFPESVPHPPL